MSNFHVNSFQVPNALVDKLMNEMSGNALKCLMYIIRQTRGWNKQYDSIAASKFVEACGISKNTALGALEELVSLGLIRKDKSERSTGLNTYSLTSMFDAGVVHDTSANSAPAITASANSELSNGAKTALVQNLNRAEIEPASAKIAPVASANSAPTKDILFKNTIQNTNTPAKPKTTRANAKTAMAPDFSISEAVRKWAKENGHIHLEARLEYFRGYAVANGKTYADWDQAFQNSIRDDWAKLNNAKAAGQAQASHIAPPTDNRPTEAAKPSAFSSFSGFDLQIFNEIQKVRPELTETDVRYLADNAGKDVYKYLLDLKKEISSATI